MSHIVAIWSFGNYYAKYKPSGWKLFVIVSIGSLVLIGFGCLVMWCYDGPVRAWLNRKYGSPKKVRTVTAGPVSAS